ncbi:MAG: NAD(P)-dependent oxidoreductase [Bacteroidia bacterium]
MQEVFLVTDTVPQGFLDELHKLGFRTEYVARMNTEELEPIVHMYDGIVVNTAMHMDKNMLDKAQKLKYVLRPGSGLDNIDVAYAESKNILVLNSPEGNKDAVAEHALALLLSLLNYIPRAWEQVQNMDWVRQPNTGTELKGKTVAIIGYGNTGSAFARKLSGFETQILVYDKYKTDINDSYVSTATLEEIYEMADVVSFHIPLTPETRHWINDDFINSFSKPVYLLNTSRGGIAKTDSIITGLENRKLLGAGLDVLENEKIAHYTETEKAVFLKLIKAGNVIITPHIAGWTQEARNKIFFMVLDKFSKWLQHRQAR